MQNLDPGYDFPEEYDECEELNKLAQLIHNLTDPDGLSDEEVDRQYIAVAINGVVTRFFMGGPQIEGVCQFIKQIADENCYEVDFNEGTVK